ncbi:DUF1492 domain-containing protein [Ligilactobacillus sp. 110_WCHN]|uniref:DUF1492 domain-containing protein n=1 Tax=Ligilactobacillus sp. 110_WCHN TaxID=3057125 RepID=UPI0026729F21|nr:DUF1492 domain-containing protein [Ligilactobacillus sp. 110_WCHN]MDO3392943.1 DUF1492 domain-containing protein [Ligilactobacillus sp. 110_WCHN]
MKQVKQFFKKDYPRYKQLSVFADLGSVNFDGVKSSSNINHQEQKMVKTIEAKNIIEIVNIIIDNIFDNRYKTILKKCYLQNVPKWQVENELMYSYAVLFELQNKALLLFAEPIKGFKKY